MSTASSRAILRILKDLDGYLNRFNQSQRPALFEKLIAEAFSSILYLPFYTSDSDNSQIPNRVVWFGRTNPLSKAPPEKPDAIAHCCDFHVVVEATMKTGATQWSQEFGPSIRHCEDFCTGSGVSPRDAYVLVVCTQLHVDTYRSIRSHPRQEYRLVPLEVADVERILQTSILAFTVRHLELRGLFHSICDCIAASSSLAEFRTSVNDTIVQWQKNILRLEKDVFIGIKSYEIMRRIGRQHSRQYIGTTEILNRLQKHWVVNQYFKLIGNRIGTDAIEGALVSHSFAAKVGATYDDEQLFQPVPSIDFKQRGLRLIRAVEDA